jgi:hypothetical protein
MEIILLLISLTMSKITIDIECCDFCIEFHTKNMKNVPPDYVRKRAVTECRLCQQTMCADCQTSSQKELKGDVLAIYGLTMCQRCITQVWRLTTRHKEYETIAEKGLEKFKAGIRKEIYTLTQEKHAVSN